ncbi:hypothetical protein ACS3SW_06325 [Roseobacteraceae bacterium S113]
MPSPNRNIELTVQDMELIETALRTVKADRTADDHACGEARQIHELLGKLHNQKVFYRPSDAPYIGG